MHKFINRILYIHYIWSLLFVRILKSNKNWLSDFLWTWSAMVACLSFKRFVKLCYKGKIQYWLSLFEYTRYCYSCRRCHLCKRILKLLPDKPQYFTKMTSKCVLLEGKYNRKIRLHEQISCLATTERGIYCLPLIVCKWKDLVFLNPYTPFESVVNSASFWRVFPTRDGVRFVYEYDVLFSRCFLSQYFVHLSAFIEPCVTRGATVVHLC